jgi:hypothetical protein
MASPLQGLPVPALSDAPNGPAQIGALAAAVEKLAVMRFASASARASVVTSPERGMTTFLADTGAEEVYYGSTTGWRPAWNRAWGQIGYVEVTTGQTGITSQADVTSLTLTWAALANRRYRITGKIEVTPTAADGAYNMVLTDAANTEVQRTTDACLTTSSRTAILLGCYTYSAGSITRKLRLAKIGGTGSLSIEASTAHPAFLLVEDIGPTGNAPSS